MFASSASANDIISLNFIPPPPPIIFPVSVVFVNTQVIEAIYSSYPLKIFLPFFPGATNDTRIIVKDVYNKTEKPHKFLDIYEIRRFHPASCLVVILMVRE